MLTLRSMPSPMLSWIELLIAVTRPRLSNAIPPLRLLKISVLLTVASMVPEFEMMPESKPAIRLSEIRRSVAPV